MVGGTLGLLAGIGAIAIPGLGPFIAAGPIMGALAGLGAGGAVGTQQSSVLTAMSNIMLVPKIGPVHPYGLFGVGLMKTHVGFNRTDVTDFNNTGVAWNTGLGATVIFLPHIGIRGDIRHFHSTQSFAIPFIGTTPTSQNITFGRISGALVLAFGICD